MSQLQILTEDLPSSAGGDDLAKPFKVSELVALLKSDVEKKHRHVRVVGELSSFKQWRSGHCYFDIKDEQSLIPAVMFRPHFDKVPFKVSDGLEVLFTGRISIYQASARLQMIVEKMEPLGQGALFLAFEQVKNRLKGEGLFDAQHKKPIKVLNENIGIITSGHGAALRDMVRIINNRNPRVNIILRSVRVQGAGAKDEISSAIKLLDQCGCDVIILGRGGGSLEDLWAFNEEEVARAIFAATTPIISAVGHETDHSVSDFVADIRAATPTHAAQIAVADLNELLSGLSEYKKTFHSRLNGKIKHCMVMLASEKKRLLDPRILLFKHWQRLDELTKKLHDHATGLMRNKKKKLAHLKDRFHQEAPYRKLRERRQNLAGYISRLNQLNPATKISAEKSLLALARKDLDEAMAIKVKSWRNQLAQYAGTLHALSPLAVLSRGFTLVTDKSSKHMIKSKALAEGHENIEIRFHDGHIDAKIIK